MDFQLDSIDDRQLTTLENWPEIDSIANDTNLGIFITYNFNPLETFPETSLADSSIQLSVNDYKNTSNEVNSRLTQNVPDTIDTMYKYLKEGTDAFHPTESSVAGSYSTNDEEQLSINVAQNDSLPVIRADREKSSRTSISLSDCVAVTDPIARQLKIIHPLEDIYRPRYKSDYFPQAGSARRPRYVADREGNHFITLQLPSAYEHDLQDKFIRVALITVSTDRCGHYYSPYKFQRDHDDANISDENPTYIKVNTSREKKLLMKLYLVLIKSKLDQLNYEQPLKRFLDSPTQIQNIISEHSLPPKDLINQYQLDKAQIAFTLCTRLPNTSYIIYPETTVISSMIAEASLSRKSNESTKIPPVDSNQHICCPHCAHQFERETAAESDGTNKRKSIHDSSHSCPKATTTSGKANANKRQKNTSNHQ